LEASIDFAGMGAVMKSARSVLLWQALRGAHVHLGWGRLSVAIGLVVGWLPLV